MAELAVAAAAAQFIALGGSILSSLSKIIAECRNAPHRISILRGEVQQLINLVQITQSNAAVAAVFNASIDRELLFDTIGKAQRLQRLLGELHVDSDKGLAVRTWAAIRTVKKDRELEALCEGLERQKTNLLIWFANHNLENTLGITSSPKALGGQIEIIDKNTAESLPQVNEINDRMKTIHQEAMHTDQEHIAGLETINRHLECLGDAANESLPLVKDVNIRTRSIHQEVTVAAKENRSSCQSLASRVDGLCDLTNRSVPLMRVLDERTQNINSNLQLVRPSIQDSERRIQSMIQSEISRPLAELQASLTTLMTTKEAHVTQVQAHQSTIARAEYQLLSKPSELQSACDTLRKKDPGFAGKQVLDVRRYRLCSCVPNRQTHDIWKGWRYWLLSRESYSQHSNECPLYLNTQKTNSVKIRCMLPTWFLSRMIDYTFSITSGAGGFAMSPQLTVFRMVEFSEAFVLVGCLVFSRCGISDEGLAKFQEDVIERLRWSFCAGEASPFDVDPGGRTLLHIFMAGVDHLLYPSSGRSDLRTDRILYELVVPFLSMCATLGIGNDNMRHHTPWAKEDGFVCSPYAEWRDIFLYLHVNEGWQLSDFSNFLGRQGTIKACLQFPPLIEDSDFGPVSQAILAKREAKLRELISLDYDPGEQDRFGWTPLHLSVYWPLGMKILLAAGVQSNGKALVDPRDCLSRHMTPLDYAIEEKQDEAILLLLDTDSMTNQRRGHVFAKLMWYNYEPSSHIVTATIESMVRRSNHLRSLAIAHLSDCELDPLCISHKDERNRIRDTYAARTVDALENVGVKIPEALELGWLGATVYQGLYDLPPKLADRLWSSGFHDTNVFDEQGFTPLHCACLCLNLDMASWLMFHGEDPTTVVRGQSQNAFHLLSCGVRDRISKKEEYDLTTKRLDIVSRIAGLCGASCQDNCRCACSPQGCTPTSVLLRKATRRWWEKEDLFSSWCRCLDLSPDAIERYCLEFARVETFERLGITHVCCKINRTSFPLISNPMPQNTIEEIQDEEAEMIDQLKSWMILYEEERARFEGSTIQFLSKWSDMLKDELDVPALFEEYWMKECKEDRETCMAAYFRRRQWL